MNLTASQLKLLFAQWADIMSAQKEKLIEMDSIVGDGDLGLTMSDGFGAAYHAVSRSNETDIGKFSISREKRCPPQSPPLWEP